MESGPSGGRPGGPSGSADPQVPTCYRHPGRETYVSCVRCGRYACPDCLRSAAVGQQCVDCVRGAGRRSAQARTVFGARVVTGAVVTWTLLGVNIALFVLEVLRPSLGDDLGMLGLARNPGNGSLVGVGAGQWYRLVTSAFLPPPGLNGLGLLDILFNMWALVVVGPGLERMLGSARYLAVYLLSAVGGAVLLYYLAPPYELALGASGAIFGLFGAWFVVARRLRLDSRWIVLLIVINLAFSFAVPDIAWQDHLGGLITGGALTAVYAYLPRAHRRLVQGGATVAVIALLTVAVAIRNGQLGAAVM